MAVRVFFETGKRIALVACGPLAGSSEHSAQLGPGLPYPQASHAPGRRRGLAMLEAASDV